MLMWQPRLELSPHGYAVKVGERAGTLDKPREISLGRGTSFTAGVIFYFISIWTIGFLVFLFFGSVDLSGKSKMKFIFFLEKGGGGLGIPDYRGPSVPN